MQGIVTDSITGKPISLVTVVNTVTQAATYTNDLGQYTIAAKPGNAIVFSYVGYKTTGRTAPQAILIGSLNVVMEHSEYQLQEYQLHQSNKTQYQIDSADRRSIYHSELARQHPSPINSPVSALAEQFSQKAKRTYKFQEEYGARETQRFIDTRYTPDLVHIVTGLTGDSIGHFMYACPMPYDFARTAGDLELKMWVRSNYKQWMKNETAGK